MRFFNPGAEGRAANATVNGQPAVRVPQSIVGYDQDGNPNPPRYLECPEGAVVLAFQDRFHVVKKGEWFEQPAGISVHAIQAAAPQLRAEVEAAFSPPNEVQPAGEKKRPEMNARK